MKTLLICRNNNQNGYTLIIAILTLFIISILGLGLISTTSSTMKKTANERDNQSAYYIAESGITQERVEIKKIAKLAFDETKIAEAAYIAALKEHQETKPAPFDFQSEFIQNAKEKINKKYTNLPEGSSLLVISDSNLIKMSSKVTYTKQKGIEPTSETTVKPDYQNSTTKKLIYTIKSTGKIGDNNKRTISQIIQISLDQDPGKKKVVIENPIDPTPPSLNSCYAVYTSGTFNGGSATIKGDVYSTKKLVIENTGASYRGSIYSTEDIIIKGSNGIKNVYSQKDVTLSGGSISGSVYGNNISIDGYPKISQDVIALNNINITSWVEIGGHYKYGNNFSNTTTSQETSKASQLTNGEITNLKKEYSFENNNENNFNNTCTATIPKLKNTEDVFRNTNLPIYPNKKITSTDNSGTSFAFVEDGILSVNAKASNQVLILDSDIYLKKINITGNETLYIDLKGQTHSIYVDSLNLAGKIKLINQGVLNLYIKDKMYLNHGSINENGGSSQTNIYYAGADKLTIASNINLMSSLHVKNADLTLTSGSKVAGNIFVYGNNNVEVSGGSKDVEQLFLAPNCNFVQSEGGTINGNIVAKNYVNSGGGSVNPPSKTEQPGSLNPGGSSTTTIELDDFPAITDDFVFIQSQIEEKR
ncbi:hypothetical protein CW357_01380 [Rummeliibacillus sp. TYF005]|uniref:PilX N-terminal domain-containing pilus assembly protein n=1 Tax=unclassified Rummeliibacillus TaxID=2622809 RepID=UPI000E6660FE|nr:MULTISPECIES: PilX N-terminal domain-containing pilus assembly protein [unclassified Rummeliibacillus]RIJ64716.1 hypothetical protein D1606_09525 [Rummeliibacillus sp. POC4]RPJ97343.1 hypothetical protein CW357_01380 [Rummeliibacillus sp. TYF005]